MENTFLNEGLLFFALFCLVLIVFEILTITNYNKDLKVLENKNKDQQNIIFLLTLLLDQNSSEKDLIDFIKENEILSLDLDDEYFINYYSERIKKHNPEDIGRYLFYLENQLLGFFKYQEISEKLQYFLKCAIIKNVSFSALIISGSIRVDNVFTEKCRKFILKTFSEKNKEIFLHNNESEINVSPFSKLFLKKLKIFVSSVYEEEINQSKKIEIKKQLIDIENYLSV